MGVSVSVYAAVGVMVPKRKLYTRGSVNDKVRGCEHKLDDVHWSAKFCPYCGAPVLKDNLELKPVKGYDPDAGLLRIETYRGTLTYEVIVPQECGENDLVLVAHGVNESPADPLKSGWATAFLPASDASALKYLMQEHFSSLGIWDEKLFGIWAVASGSF